MVDLYLAARLHNRISDADYRSLLLKQDLDTQEQKLRQTLLRLVEASTRRSRVCRSFCSWVSRSCFSSRDL